MENAIGIYPAITDGKKNRCGFYVIFEHNIYWLGFINEKGLKHQYPVSKEFYDAFIKESAKNT